MSVFTSFNLDITLFLYVKVFNLDRLSICHMCSFSDKKYKEHTIVLVFVRKLFMVIIIILVV